MNIRKSCLLIILAVLPVLCACGNGSLPNESAETVSSASSAFAAIVENSASEKESFSAMESSATESSETFSAESTDFFAVDSLTDPVILLPFHTKEDYPRDFVSAMSNNPIDKLWNHNCYLAGIEGDIALPIHSDITEQATRLWEQEIETTISQIRTVWSDVNQEELEQYAKNAVRVSLERVSVSGLDWGDRGTIFSLICFAPKVDAYRQVAFQLKYWLYLIETSNGGQANVSLQFEAESTYDAMPFSAVLCGHVTLLEIPHAPSYWGEGQDVWIASMKNHPLNQATAEQAIPKWKEEIQADLQRLSLHAYEGKETWARQYAEAFLQHCKEEREWEVRLMQAGYLADNDSTREVIAWQETDSYRRLAFTLGYWSSALEEMLSA